MSNITRKDWKIKFFDTIFHNQSISIGKDGKLNNIDNRFDKCTFTTSYCNNLLKILEIIIFEPTVIIKNRNTKRNGEYTEISHDEIMRRLSDFLKYQLEIDISLYYKMANDEFSINKDTTSTYNYATNEKKVTPISQELLVFIIISDIILVEIFNKEKIGKKENGYGNIDTKELKNYMIPILMHLCKQKNIFFKLKYPITTWLLNNIKFNVDAEEKEPVFDNEALKSRDITDLLNELDETGTKEGKKTETRCYIMKNRSELLTLSDSVIIKTYWKTIEMFYSYKCKSPSLLARSNKIANCNEYYYFREYMLMFEDIIRSHYMDYFIMTFDNNKISYKSHRNDEININKRYAINEQEEY